jgi:hypothetical protein
VVEVLNLSNCAQVIATAVLILACSFRVMQVGRNV